MKSNKKRIELNWDKLVGFNQVRTRENKQAKAVLSAKIGGKGGGVETSPDATISG